LDAVATAFVLEMLPLIALAMIALLALAAVLAVATLVLVTGAEYLWNRSRRK
jgi:hypothetical protein